MPEKLSSRKSREVEIKFRDREAQRQEIARVASACDLSAAQFLRRLTRSALREYAANPSEFRRRLETASVAE